MNPVEKTTLTLTNNLDPIIWIVVVFVLLLVSWWSYGTNKNSPTTRFLLTCTRLSTLIFVLLLFLEPAAETSKQIYIQDQVLVLVDRTGSMGVEDVPVGGGRISREDQAQNLMTNTVWNTLSTTKDVKWFGFDYTSFPLVSNEDMAPPTGRRTDVPGVILNINEEIETRPTSAIILISDGRSSDPPPPGYQQKIRTSGVPIISVPLGSPDVPGDIAITRVDKPDRAYGTDNIPVNIQLEFQGDVGTNTLILEDVDTGVVLDSTTIDPISMNNGDGVTLVGRPRGTDDATWRVRLEQETPDLILRNNVNEFTIQLTDQPLKTLYVEGRPRWEYRYLKNLLLRERTIESSTMLLSADSDFTQEGDRPISRLPSTREEFEQWDVLIIGDVPASSLTEAQCDLIRELVAEGRLDLLWIGGERWTPSTWATSPLADLIPFSPPFKLQTTNTLNHIVPTDAADTMGIMQMEDVDGSFGTTSNPDLGWSGFRWMQKVDRNRLKPGTNILGTSSTTKSGGQQDPILLSMRYGLGHVIYSATDEYWRWRHGRGERLYEQFWIQILRALARNQSEEDTGVLRMNVSHRNPKVDTPINIEVTITDNDMVETVGEFIQLTLRDPNGNRNETIDLKRVDGTLNTFSTTWTPRNAGPTILSCLLPPTHKDVSPPETTINVMDPSDEYRQPETDHQALQLLSDISGGGILLPGEVESLPTLLPDRSTTTIEIHRKYLWDSPWLFLIPMLFLTTEWLARRFLRLA